MVEELKEAWSEAAFTQERNEGTAQLNAKAIGKAQALKEVLELGADDLINYSKESKK